MCYNKGTKGEEIPNNFPTVQLKLAEHARQPSPQNKKLRRCPPVMCTANIAVRVKERSSQRFFGRLLSRKRFRFPNPHFRQIGKELNFRGRRRFGNAGREVLYVQIRLTKAHKIGGRSNVQFHSRNGSISGSSPFAGRSNVCPCSNTQL